MFRAAIMKALQRPNALFPSPALGPEMGTGRWALDPEMGTGRWALGPEMGTGFVILDP